MVPLETALSCISCKIDTYPLFAFSNQNRNSFAMKPSVPDENTPENVTDNAEQIKALKNKLWTTKPVIDKSLVSSALKKLRCLRNSVAQLTGYRFYSASLLLIYEGKAKQGNGFSLQDASNKASPSFSTDVSVRLIDFAHYCCGDENIHPGPDGGILYGLDNLIMLLDQFLQ